MTPVDFPERNIEIAKNQPEYLTLPAHFAQDREGRAQGRSTFCWKLSWRERLKVLFSGRIWQSSLTFGHPLQPQLVSADKPDMELPGQCANV